MTDLNQFVSDAIRTESHIDKVITNGTILEGILMSLIAAGNALDVVKKSVFYNKPLDEDRLHELSQTAEIYAQQISPRNRGPVQNEFDVDPRLFHAIIGIATESTELLEALNHALQGNELDLVNVREELGDINWYEAIALDTLDADFDSVLNTVIAKLKARYPEKFTVEDAINRDLVTERNILEDK